MTDPYLVALTTYGKKTVDKLPVLKIGSGAVAPVLLRLFGDRAREVTPKRASYRYIHIEGRLPKLQGGYLLLQLTEAELDAVEALCRQCNAVSARIYVWHQGAWLECPTRERDYQPAQQGPRFHPLLHKALSPGQPVGQGRGAISVEYQQRDPDKPGWWWLSGDTYPHRRLIKGCGGRWSARRRAWYLVAHKLPDALRALVEDGGSAPETRQPASEPQQPDDDDGLDLMPGWLIRTIGQRRGENDNRALDQQLVFAKLFTPDADWVLWVADYDAPNRRLFCYALLNGDLQMAEWGWQCLDDLQALRGRMGLPMERDTGFQPQLLSAALDQWQRQRGLVDVPQPPLHEVVLDTETEEPAATGGIKVIPAPTDDEDLQALLQETGTVLEHTRTPPPDRPGTGLAPIGQAFCGELTGDISGSVYCYGYATYEGVLVYLNYGGPRSGVEAIRAKLAKGQPVNLHPPDGPSIELSPGSDGDGDPDTGRYTAFSQNLSEARFMSQILVHDWLTQPNYQGDSVTFIFPVSPAQARAQLLQHVRKLVAVAVFDAWREYLWQAGTTAMLLRPARSGGGIDLLSLQLDTTAWTRLICGGLEQQLIALPETTATSA
jgi:hypothetical protein